MAHTASVELRIEHIADMMRSLTFRTGKTVRELAVEWGLSRESVSNYAAEASKRVLAEFNDVDHVKVSVGVALQKVIEGAMQDLDTPPLVATQDGRMAWPESPNKTRQSIINAADKLAEIMGSKAAQKVQLSGSVALDDIDAAMASAKKNDDGSGNDGGGPAEG